MWCRAAVVDCTPGRTVLHVVPGVTRKRRIGCCLSSAGCCRSFRRAPSGLDPADCGSARKPILLGIHGSALRLDDCGGGSQSHAHRRTSTSLTAVTSRHPAPRHWTPRVSPKDSADPGPASRERADLGKSDSCPADRADDEADPGTADAGGAEHDVSFRPWSLYAEFALMCQERPDLAAPGNGGDCMNFTSGVVIFETAVLTSLVVVATSMKNRARRGPGHDDFRVWL